MEEEQSKQVMRPVISPSAIEHARRMAALGLGHVEQHADGRLWAEGPDRRARSRGEEEQQAG